MAKQDIHIVVLSNIRLKYHESLHNYKLYIEYNGIFYFQKPTCELCGKTFQNIAALKGHRAVHTKEKVNSPSNIFFRKDKSDVS